MESQCQEMKTCLCCQQVKPLSEFYKKARTTDRRDTRCRICRAAYVRKYRAENPEIVKAIQLKTRIKHADKHRARTAKWYRDNHSYAKEQMAKRRKEKPDVVKNAHLRLNFGITIHDYNLMLQNQGHCCAICGIKNGSTARKLCVDHCHTSGAIRGLLCGKCNSAIGLLGDSTELMKKAISYLETAKQA